VIKIRVAVVSTAGYPTPPIGYGGEVFVWHLVQALERQNEIEEVNLFACYDSKKPNRGKLFKLKKGLDNWEKIHSYERDCIKRYNKELKEADIVHDFSHSKAVADYCFIEKIPCISTLFGVTFLYPNYKYNIVCWSKAHKEAGLRGEGALSALGHKEIAGSLKNAEVVYGGTDTDFYKPNYKKEDYFLYVGRPHPTKGVDLVIELAKQTKKKVILAWKAEIEEHKRYEKYFLEQIKKQKNIEFVELPNNEKHQTLKRELLQKAKALIFPVQYIEAFGLVVVEALSCGTPVITTTKGSMPEIVDNGENGFICHSFQHLKSAMKNIDYIENKKCRRTAEKKFNMERVAKDYMRLYRRAMRGETW